MKLNPGLFLTKTSQNLKTTKRNFQQLLPINHQSVQFKLLPPLLLSQKKRSDQSRHIHQTAKTNGNKKNLVIGDGPRDTQALHLGMFLLGMRMARLLLTTGDDHIKRHIRNIILQIVTLGQLHQRAITAEELILVMKILSTKTKLWIDELEIEFLKDPCIVAKKYWILNIWDGIIRPNNTSGHLLKTRTTKEWKEIDLLIEMHTKGLLMALPMKNEVLTIEENTKAILISGNFIGAAEMTTIMSLNPILKT